MTSIVDPPEQLSTQTFGQVLLSGGDARLVIDPKTGVNKYGCGSRPDPALLSFGSSTGSTISERGYRAAHALHERLFGQEQLLSEAALYHQELERVRLELNRLCGLGASTASIFAASGTDLHLLCAQLMASPNLNTGPLHIIMMDACETGSGVAPALRGRHFNGNATPGAGDAVLEPLTGAYPVKVSSIGLRCANGLKRPIADIDTEVEALIQQSLAIQQRVLLIMIDVSKTGMIAPSPACVAAQRARHADQVDVLVDACQFRISNSTLKAYLNLGCMVALTGSKFLTGPVFSGVLQIPAKLASRLAQQTLPPALTGCSARAEWPEYWRARQQLPDTANWGLLLRFEAALSELKAFRALNEDKISSFLKQFADAIQHALHASPHFELLSETQLDRHPICTETGWDQIPTIFPFLLLHRPGSPLDRNQVQQIYRQLQFPVQIEGTDPATADRAALRCQLGQPVLCGARDGVEISALRLCASSRIIIEACSSESSAVGVIQRALQVLRKTESLIQKMC